MSDSALSDEVAHAPFSRVLPRTPRRSPATCKCNRFAELCRCACCSGPALVAHARGRGARACVPYGPAVVAKLSVVGPIRTVHRAHRSSLFRSRGDPRERRASA